MEALDILIHGDGSLNENDDDTIELQAQNHSYFGSITDIPTDLRYQCFVEISRKARTNKKIDIKTEFNRAVGNINETEAGE